VRGSAGVAFEHLHRHRTTVGIGQQPKHDLRIAAPLIARVAVAGERTAVALEISRAHIVEHQAALTQMTACEGGFDLRLLRQQPIEGSVEIVFIDRRHAQFRAERAVCGFLAQRTGRRQFGAGPEYALNDQRQHPTPLRAGLKQLVELEAAQRAQHRRDLAVGQRARHFERLA
jgi:hypothetical protein